jgi:hypothetical protein
MILGVEQTATLRLISSSYRRLALTLHPDRNAKHDATEAFQRVCPLSRAKLVLSIITLYMLKLDIEAWTSLRDIEGRKQTQSLRSHLPLHTVSVRAMRGFAECAEPLKHLYYLSSITT